MEDDKRKGTRREDNSDNPSSVKDMHIFSEGDESSENSFTSKLSSTINTANAVKEKSVDFAKNHTPSKYIKKGKEDVKLSKEKAYSFFNKIDNKKEKIKSFHNSAHQLIRKNNIVSGKKGDAVKNIIAIALYIGAVFLWLFGHWFISIIIFAVTTIIYFLLSYSLN